MFVERLKTKFGSNEPIFTDEILASFPEYSTPRIFQLLAEAAIKKDIIHFDVGVYYLPSTTIFGTSSISADSVAEKKYVKKDGKVFGIYGRLIMELNFFLSYQVPNKVEIITNNESRAVREVTIGGRPFVLRKARLPITNDNCGAYTIMELFCNIDLRQYRENRMAQKEIRKYIEQEKILKDDLFALAGAFPARTMKNLAESGLLNEIA